MTSEPVAVAEERFDSPRPYHVLAGCGDGTHEMREWNGGTKIPERWRWFVSGIPCLWDDEEGETLLQRLLPEVADHSHFWRVFRGTHPQANGESSAQWRELHAIFRKMLVSDAASTYDALMRTAQRMGLVREEAILHNVVGVDGAGRLLQLLTSGRLESIGLELRSMGAVRALCLDNSGSSVVAFRPSPITAGGSPPIVQLAAAPNHRPPGTAIIVIELESGEFGQLPRP